MGVVFATYSVQQCATVCNSVQLCAQYSSNIKNTKLCNDNELCIAQYSCAATSAWELGHLGPASWEGELGFSISFLIKQTHFILVYLLLFGNFYSNIFITKWPLLSICDRWHLPNTCTLAQAECRPHWSKDQRIVPMRSLLVIDSLIFRLPQKTFPVLQMTALTQSLSSLCFDSSSSSSVSLVVAWCRMGRSSARQVFCHCWGIDPPDPVFVLYCYLVFLQCICIVFVSTRLTLYWNRNPSPSSPLSSTLLCTLLLLLPLILLLMPSLFNAIVLRRELEIVFFISSLRSTGNWYLNLILSVFVPFCH